MGFRRGGHLDVQRTDTAAATCTRFLSRDLARRLLPFRRVGQEPRKSGERRRRTTRSTIVTDRPDVPAPALICPHCDRPLIYRHRVLGGVKPLERWDYFQCLPCGFFEYRARTRTLRLMGHLPVVRVTR